jgi:DNA (cytosine-5)-methyltransferase 1
MPKGIPVIDLFAGPGGLGEGFTAFKDAKQQHPFRIALSIEKDPQAHATLELRSFFRQFKPRCVPNTYYRFLRGEISRKELFAANPKEARAASAEAWQAELGSARLSTVRKRISKAIGGLTPWILIGGPPCQAYSVAGRSRNKGVESYDPERDVKQTLYVEYLQILADHRPAVFVMENVKGLLSATLSAKRLFERIVEDLRDPLKAIAREGRTTAAKKGRLSYRIQSLTVDDRQTPLSPADYLVHAERYGIPQARHRVILLGVRGDLDCGPPKRLRKRPQVALKKLFHGLPRLRSGVTRHKDSTEMWLRVIESARDRAWLAAVRKNGGARVAHKILSLIENHPAPRGGRGDEFIECMSNIDYRKDWFLDARIEGVCNHSSRKHMDSDLHRYLFATCFAAVNGQSPQLRHFPKRLLPKHSNVALAVTGTEYFADRFRVQVANRPATTITSHISKDGHYFIHPDPEQCRSLTVREAARLQTFPDNYFFCGNKTEQYVQVGNAVPPLLALQIAAIVHDLTGRIRG